MMVRLRCAACWLAERGARLRVGWAFFPKVAGAALPHPAELMPDLRLEISDFRALWPDLRLEISDFRGLRRDLRLGISDFRGLRPDLRFVIFDFSALTRFFPNLTFDC